MIFLLLRALLKGRRSFLDGEFSREGITMPFQAKT
jgi:hypothetical protein